MENSPVSRADFDRYFVPNYAPADDVLVRGAGSRVWGASGREYVDLAGGIAVNVLGHADPRLAAVLAEQASTLWHVSNAYANEPALRLARSLVERTFADRVFLANSGAEANEAALKLARIHSGPGRYEVISLTGSFHGRTLATVAATGQPRFHQGFEPLPHGFVHAEFGEMESLERLIGDRTCAIMCEPLQGESGVRPLEPEYLAAIRKLCDRHNLLLIFDEVQTGMGRTGTLFAYEQLGVTPDILTLAKAMGNGLPIGVMLTREDIAASLTVGTHASTFGGNPVAAAAGVAVLKLMLADGFLAGVREKGEYLAGRLADVARRFPALASGVRGRGLLLGLVLTEKGREQGPAIVQGMFEQGVLINFAGNSVLRFIPPLIVSREETDRMIAALVHVLGGLA